MKADYGVQWDGGFTGIGLAAQGRTRFLVRTRGVSYHGQVPILGVNAIEKMSKINVALTDYWRNVLLERQREVSGIELGSALRTRGVTKMTAMLNIGTIKGGVQGATVPDLCEEEVLRGMIPGETFSDVKEEFVYDFIIPTLRAHAVYEGKYVLSTAIGRPLIAKHLVRIAQKEKAKFVAHGCTGKGNDQVRIEVAVSSLDPSLEIIAPLREWQFKSREEEIDYAKKNNIKIS